MNIANLNKEQRADIELHKKACLLLFNLNYRNMSRHDAKVEIESIKCYIEREKFRALLNKLR